MKYDLKAMKFKPDNEDLIWAFTWDETPEGYNYWERQYYSGTTPEGQAKWNAMKRQWNEENAPDPDSPSMYGMLSEMWRNPTSTNCRCTITPAQRYVVLTDDETIICTRAEAEDLAAGGVDAVYKLGDKVEVTVKVEFDVS